MVALALLGLYLAFWPVKIQPVAWRPPAPVPFEGALALNDRLAHGERLLTELEGAEAVTFDAEGRIVTGLLDGRIVRIEGTRVVTLATTGGRPLGLEYDAEGRLVVADAYRGLLRVDEHGRVETLATTHGGRPFRFTDDLVIARDGTIYFSDASYRFSLTEYKLDLLEHRPNGRVLAYHPTTGQVEEIARELFFANGVALTPDESALIVCETFAYRLVRISLREGSRGRKSPFAPSLPGFCDNVRYSEARGVYWVAIGSPRIPKVDALAAAPEWRRVTARLPAFFYPQPVKHGMVIAISPEGRFVESLHHVADDAYSPIAGVVEHEGALYLSSFSAHGILRVPLR